MTANEIIVDLFKYIDESWVVKFILTEASMGNYKADLIFMQRHGLMSEIEVKVSMSDLKAELKKTKWGFGLYETNLNSGVAGKVPSYFYFCIPKSMQDKALPFIEKHWKFAGVLTCDETGTIESVKRSKCIHNFHLSEDQERRYRDAIASRYRSLYKKLYSRKSLIKEDK